MADSAGAAAVERVLRAIQARGPLRWRVGPLPPDLPLGRGGLDLDSIAIVELLLDCESATGLPFPPQLFDGGPITVGRLVEHAAGRADHP